MTPQKDVLKTVYQCAFNYEVKLGICPQCVLATLKETLNVGDESIFQAVHGLTGGTALSLKGTYGALAGGMFVIGNNLPVQ
jgi:hypothetical protein